MFITPFPIIFLQIKVSPWHLFPWQRRRYFTFLPSTLNLSGYENSIFFPQLTTLVLSVQPLKPTSWGSFLSDLNGKCGWCLIFLSLSLPLVLTPSLPPTHCESEGTPCWISFNVALALTMPDLKKTKKTLMPRTNTVFIRFCLTKTERERSGGKKKRNLPR